LRPGLDIVKVRINPVSLDVVKSAIASQRTAGRRSRAQNEVSGFALRLPTLLSMTAPTDKFANGSAELLGEFGENMVHPIQPYQARKSYVCPGCDGVIEVGVGHLVVVPEEAPDLRRHWHRGCWYKERRRLGHHRSPDPA
jgi:hypothetical protein